MVVAAAIDDLLIGAAAQSVGDAARLAEVEHTSFDRAQFAGRDQIGVDGGEVTGGNRQHLTHRSVARPLARHVEDRMVRSDEHTSELQSLMRISYAVFCLKKKNNTITT